MWEVVEIEYLKIRIVDSETINCRNYSFLYVLKRIFLFKCCIVNSNSKVVKLIYAYSRYDQVVEN